MDFCEITLRGIPKIEFVYNVAVNNYRNQFPSTKNLLEISLCLENNIVVDFKDSQKIIYHPNSLMIIAKDTVCRTYAQKSGLHRHITFGVSAEHDIKRSRAEKIDAAQLKCIEERIARGESILLPEFTDLGDKGKSAEQLITRALSKFYSNNSTDTFGCISIWFELCEMLTAFTLKKIRRLHMEGLPSDERYIESAVRYISEHIHERIMIEDIAATVDLSAGYMQNLFKSVTGLTVIEYINREKVELVKGYTSGGRMTLSKAAEMVGIGDSAYMSRLFKRVTGTSFLQYLEQCQKRNDNTIIKFGP